MQHILDLTEGNRQAALFEVHLLRCAEPQHIFSPLSNGFDVQQMLYAYVFRDRVSAPGTAAQRQRRRKLKVVQITDAAVRGRCVDYDTAGLHPCRKLFDLFPVVDLIHIEGCCMAIAAVLDQLVRIFHCLLEVLRTVHCQYRRELFVCELFADVHRSDFTDEDTCFLRNGHAGKSCDGCRTLTYDLAVECAVDENGLTHLFSLIGREEIAAALQKFLADCVINGFVNDHRLLRCADHAVVKCLRVYDRVYRLADIRRGIDHCRGVAGANAQRRFAAGICCTHHSRTAGCQNDVSLLHQRVGHFQRRNVDPADDILRCTCLHGCIQHDLRRSDGAFLCTGMGRNDNGISGFQDLKIAVDVGLVVGMTAATTPIGSAIRVVP